jgi:hypothetical protein
VQRQLIRGQRKKRQISARHGTQRNAENFLASAAQLVDSRETASLANQPRLRYVAANSAGITVGVMNWPGDDSARTIPNHIYIGRKNSVGLGSPILRDDVQDKILSRNEFAHRRSIRIRNLQTHLNRSDDLRPHTG